MTGKSASIHNAASLSPIAAPSVCVVLQLRVWEPGWLHHVNTCKFPISLSLLNCKSSLMVPTANNDNLMLILTNVATPGCRGRLR